LKSKDYSYGLAWSINHLENITVTRGENVKFQCRFPTNFSSKENIIQWQKARFNDDNFIISINGKIPKTLEQTYRTDLTTQSSSLELFHVDRQDSTTYICQTFETQTILCQFNLVVLSKLTSKPKKTTPVDHYFFSFIS